MTPICTRVDKDTLPGLLEALDGIAAMESDCLICKFNMDDGFSFLRTDNIDPSELHIVEHGFEPEHTNAEFVRLVTEACK